MKCVSMANPYRKMYDTAVPSYGTEGKYEQVKTMKEAAGARSCDVLDISADWSKETREFLEQMRQEYRGIQIAVRESVSGVSVPGIAEQLGGGTYLVVSRDFLKRMGSSREDYLACRNVMEDILRQLADEAGNHLGNGAVLDDRTAVFWSVPEREAPLPCASSERAGTGGAGPDIREQSVRAAAGSAAYASAAGYARLAGARTKGQVRTVMGEAHRSIAALRLVIALGDDKEKARARAAVGSMQKLLVRGSRKLKKLDEETLVKIRRNRAQKQRQMKKARRLKQELEKKRSMRYCSDSALRMEGRLDEASRKLRFYDEKGWEPDPSGAVDPGLALGGGAAGLPDGGSFAASEVAVSEPVSF